MKEHIVRMYCAVGMVVWVLFGLFAFGAATAQSSNYGYDLSAESNDPAVLQAGVLLEAITRLHPVADDASNMYLDFKATKNDQQTLTNMVDKRVAFGIAKGASMVADGKLKNIFERELRVVALLWQEAVHFLAKKQYVQSGTLSDLRALSGNKILLGTTGSPASILENQVLTPLMLRGNAQQTKDDYEGIIWLSGLPSGLVGSLDGIGSDWIFLDTLSFQGQQIDSPAWTLKTLKSDHYEGSNADINIFTQGIYLLSLSTIDSASIVYLLEALFQDCFKVTTRTPLGVKMPFDAQIQEWKSGFLPFHEGALAYYLDALEQQKEPQQRGNKKSCR